MIISNRGKTLILLIKQAKRHRILYALGVLFVISIVIASIFLAGKSAGQLSGISLTKKSDKIVTGHAPSARNNAVGSANESSNSSHSTTIASRMTGKGAAPVGYGKSVPSPIKTQPLRFSSSSITVYKSTGKVPGLKYGVTDVDVTLSSSDGKLMRMPLADPYSEVILEINSMSGPTRTSWSMNVSSSGMSLGTQTVAVTAFSADGSTKYTGKLTVTVKPIPVFSISFTGGTAEMVRLNDANYVFVDVSYHDNFGGVYRPVLSVPSADGISFEYLNFAADENNDIFFSSNKPFQPGDYALTMVFENQFQRIVVPWYLDVLNY